MPAKVPSPEAERRHRPGLHQGQHLGEPEPGRLLAARRGRAEWQAILADAPGKLDPKQYIKVM